MNNIVYKKATAADWQVIATIEKTAESKLFFPLEDKDEIFEYIIGSTVYILMDNKTPVGTASYKIEKDGTIHLDGLVIIPSYQRKGLARMVMEKIMSEMGNKKYSLTVHPSNNAAIKLYLDLGFIITARKDNYLGDGQPRLVMERSQK